MLNTYLQVYLEDSALRPASFPPSLLCSYSRSRVIHTRKGTTTLIRHSRFSEYPIYTLLSDLSNSEIGMTDVIIIIIVVLNGESEIRKTIAF
jgi:hypothetical protein